MCDCILILMTYCVQLVGVGRPKLANSTTPLKLSTEEIGPIVQVACGAEFSMILNNRGELYAFGHPDKGCLGNGTNGTCTSRIITC